MTREKVHYQKSFGVPIREVSQGFWVARRSQVSRCSQVSTPQAFNLCIFKVSLILQKHLHTSELE